MARLHRYKEVKDRGVDVLLSERVYGSVFAVARVSIHDLPGGVCRHHGNADLCPDGTMAHPASRRVEVPTTDPRRGRSTRIGRSTRQESLPDNGWHPDHLG